MIDQEKELSMFLYFKDVLARSPESASDIFKVMESTEFTYSDEFWFKIAKLKKLYI